MGYFTLRSIAKFSLMLGLAGVLSACSIFDSGDDAPPLPGERISVMALQKDLSVDVESQKQPLEMPEEWQNKFWPQAGGYPNHAMQNLALGRSLVQAWRSSIGRGSNREIPLTAQPIVIDGRVYTLDAHALLTAFDTQNGKVVWERGVAKEGEDDPVISGGLGFAENMLFVTNGYNEILALNPQNGDLIWRKELSAPSRAAPSILGGRVFVTTLDNKLIALASQSGDFLWDYQGIGESAGIVGAANAAVNNDIVIPAFSSGELSALRVSNGVTAWNENLANVRSFGGLSGISDIKALPVVDNGIVYAVSFGGKMIAIDETTGTRIWQRDVGGSETPWLAGNHIFVLSSDNQLIALHSKNGAIRWVTDLPKTIDGDVVRLTGPVFAGGRLIVTGSEGLVFELNPDNGEVLSQWSTGRSVLIAPVVADGMLYLLAEDGSLMAYRSAPEEAVLAE